MLSKVLFIIYGLLTTGNAGARPQAAGAQAGAFEAGKGSLRVVSLDGGHRPVGDALQDTPLVQLIN